MSWVLLQLGFPLPLAQAWRDGSTMGSQPPRSSSTRGEGGLPLVRPYLEIHVPVLRGDGGPLHQGVVKLSNGVDLSRDCGKGLGQGVSRALPPAMTSRPNPCPGRLESGRSRAGQPCLGLCVCREQLIRSHTGPGSWPPSPDFPPPRRAGSAAARPTSHGLQDALQPFHPFPELWAELGEESKKAAGQTPFPSKQSSSGAEQGRREGSALQAPPGSGGSFPGLRTTPETEICPQTATAGSRSLLQP